MQFDGNAMFSPNLQRWFGIGFFAVESVSVEKCDNKESLGSFYKA